MFLKFMNLLKKYALFGFLVFALSFCTDNGKEGGEEYFRAGEYEKAVEAYSEELQLKPGDVQRLYGRGRAYEELGNYEAAKEDFKKALKFDDRNVRVLIAMGDVLYKEKNFDNALFFYQKATDFEGNNAQALFKEGRAHHKLGNVDEAMAKYDAAIREDESLGDAYLYRAALHISKKNDKAACNDFLKAQTHNVEGAGEALLKYCN